METSTGTRWEFPPDVSAGMIVAALGGPAAIYHAETNMAAARA